MTLTWDLTNRAFPTCRDLSGPDKIPVEGGIFLSIRVNQAARQVVGVVSVDAGACRSAFSGSDSSPPSRTIFCLTEIIAVGTDAAFPRTMQTKPTTGRAGAPVALDAIADSLYIYPFLSCTPLPTGHIVVSGPEGPQWGKNAGGDTLICSSTERHRRTRSR